MKRLLRLNLLVIALITGVACPVNCLAWSLASQPVEGIMLLKNSNILRGKIQKQGEHYHVHLPNGKLRVREQQVETVCENLEAVYQYRRQKTGGSSADSHLDLVGWCLRHELFKHAEAELTEAEEIDSRHPRLGLLRRQLNQSLKMVEYQKQQELAKTIVVPELEPIDPATLDKAPKWARALFVRQIQPLMVHSCATGGCHQSSQESEFQLSRLAIDGVGHPGVTLRNLAETLEQINWDEAEQSDLLTRARKVHGGPKASVPLPAHKLQVLQSWVSQLAEAHRNEIKLKELPQVAVVEEPSITPTLALNAPQQATPKPAEGVRTASYQSNDPFDPSVFNDRYASAKPAAPLPPAPQAATSEQPASDTSVPHVLAPSDPVLIPLPATE